MTGIQHQARMPSLAALACLTSASRPIHLVTPDIAWNRCLALGDQSGRFAGSRLQAAVPKKVKRGGEPWSESESEILTVALSSLPKERA